MLYQVLRLHKTEWYGRMIMSMKKWSWPTSTYHLSIHVGQKRWVDFKPNDEAQKTSDVMVSPHPGFKMLTSLSEAFYFLELVTW